MFKKSFPILEIIISFDQKLLTNINHEMRTLCDAFTKF